MWNKNFIRHFSHKKKTQGKIVYAENNVPTGDFLRQTRKLIFDININIVLVVMAHTKYSIFLKLIFRDTAAAAPSKTVLCKCAFCDELREVGDEMEKHVRSNHPEAFERYDAYFSWHIYGLFG